MPAAGAVKPWARRWRRCAVHDAFHKRLGEVGYAGIEDLFGLRGEVGDDVAVGTADAGEEPGLEVDAAVGEGGVDAGHIEGCCRVGADGHGGLWGGRWDAGFVGEGGDVAVADCWARAMVAMLSECARASAAVTMPGYSDLSKLPGM